MVEHENVEPLNGPGDRVKQALRDSEPKNSEGALNQFPMDGDCRDFAKGGRVCDFDVLISEVALHVLQEAVVTHPV